MAIGKTIWTLTPEAFEQLLLRFDADRELAGRRYRTAHRKLLEFFEARGSHTPEDHADETLNRVARKISEGEVIENIDKYCYGVAKFLWMEASRNLRKEPVALDDLNLPISSNSDDEAEMEQRLEAERRIDCFEKCLHRLPPETRAFMVDYYREENGVKIEQRKQQAERLKTTLNALRLRASRVRRELGECIKSCLSDFNSDR